MNTLRDSGDTMTARGRQARAGMRHSRAMAILMGLFAAVTAASAAPPPVDISPAPLFLGSNVPGTLVLTPSVEWPTADSAANLGNTYDDTKTYVGYFDSAKCYLYSYSATETDRYFYPAGVASSHACNSSKQWSGNYLNWAATQTIDAFRMALTGGFRSTDTTTETRLSKARQDGQGSFALRSVGTGIAGATPAKAGWGSMQSRINGLGYQMYFTRNDGRPGGSPDINSNVLVPNVQLVSYNPGDSNQMKSSGKYDNDGVPGTPDVYDNRIYAVSIRVKVCVSGYLEANCKQYGSNYKPEGLIQQYSDRIRYSVFGYLNDTTETRDGAALRAQQKFVGPQTYDPTAGTAANPNKEWDPNTGVFIQNPDGITSSLGRTIADSGVINYINKFGELNTNARKGHDPVSEMYYAAIRYLKNLGNVTPYTDVSGATNAQRDQYTDGFPVITAWADPVTYSCQANAILGIGDVNTWDDKNLPSATATGAASEPAKPAQVVADTSVDVNKATKKVFDLEGFTGVGNNPFTGRNNSAYIAGLAYDSHTVDMRPDLSGSQTVSTYWSDVQENQVLEPKARNQYWLAAKYGGFRVPAGYDPYAQTAALPQSWWHASTDVLSTGDLRPDNFYTAGDAAKMVAGLQAAFAQIVASIQGTGASFGASSTTLQSGTTLFQSSYFSNSWYGDLTAYPLDPTTGEVLAPTWSANSLLLAKNWTTRKILVSNGSSAVAFNYGNLNSTQKTILGSSQVVDYLRGDRSNEMPAGTLRARTGVLGDIVSSQPVFVGAPNTSLYLGAGFTGASTYQAFAAAKAARTPMIYVGANDGMLHGFNATTGAEVFAYVPKAAITSDLASYALPGYVHRYSVDGENTIANVYIGGAWKTILVGTMGRGHPGVFALDVTDPANPSLLWDKTDADIPTLGNNLGKPIIAQVADGDWRVIFGNGPNSASGDGQLVMVKLSNGTATSVNVGGGPKNGLTAATIWNSDSDDFFDRAYAGDLLGNVWRIDGLATGSPTKIKLFAATDGTKAQPITAAPLVAIRPTSTETWVFFGTGRYLGTADVSNKDIQTWYGIKDAGTTIPGRAQLVQRNITAEAAQVSGGPVGRAIDPGTLSDVAGKSGWYIDLKSPVNGAQGERMVVPNIFQGLALVGVTRIPDSANPCSPGGTGFVMAIDPFTGGSLDSSYFDTNGDGKVDGSDSVGSSVVSGIGLATGGNGVIAVGDRIYGTLDNGAQFTPPPPPSSKTTGRVNWHEVIGN